MQLGIWLRSPLLWVALILVWLRLMALYEHSIWEMYYEWDKLAIFLSTPLSTDNLYGWGKQFFTVSAWLPILWLAWGNRPLLIRSIQSLACMFGILLLDNISLAYNREYEFTTEIQLPASWARDWYQIGYIQFLQNLVIVILPWYLVRIAGIVCISDARNPLTIQRAHPDRRFQITLTQLFFLVAITAYSLSNLIPVKYPVLTTWTSYNTQFQESQFLYICLGTAQMREPFEKLEHEGEAQWDRDIIRNANIWITLTILTAVCVGLTTWPWYVRWFLFLLYLILHLRLLVVKLHQDFQIDFTSDFSRAIIYIQFSYYKTLIGIFLALLLPLFFLRWCGYRIHFFPSRELLDSNVPPGTGKWGRIYARL